MKTTTHNPAPNTASGHTPGATKAAYAILKHPEVDCGIFAHIADEFAEIIDRETAAPDLLAALEESLTWMETYQRHTGTAEHGPLGHSITKARAALTRAKGGEVS